MSSSEKKVLELDWPHFIPIPTSLRRSKHIHCGRKVFCVEQLYGWRGMDLGYYGSASLDDLPDSMDDVKTGTIDDGMEEERLQLPGREAEISLGKEWKSRTNFNILTDRAPTPNFSITYIETSVSACDETGESGSEQTVEEDVGVTEMNVQAVVTGNDGNNSSNVFEPMEVDSSTYLGRVSSNQSVQETVANAIFKETGLREHGAANLTFTVERNVDETESPVFTGRNTVGDDTGPALVPELDGKFIVEKLLKESMQVPVQVGDHRNFSVVGSDDFNECTETSSSRLEKLSEADSRAAFQSLETDLLNGSSKSVVSPGLLNTKKHGCTTLLQTSFNSCTENANAGRKNPSKVNSSASRIPRFNLLTQLGLSERYGEDPAFVTDGTAVSFKTPKQRTRTPMEHKSIEKRAVCALPSSTFEGISQYRTPPSTPKRSFLYHCETTPRASLYKGKLSTQQAENVTITSKSSKLLSEEFYVAKRDNRSSEQHSSKLSLAPQGPLTRFAFEHLKSGGTPRPTSISRNLATAEAIVTPSEPRTPVPKADVSQMLVDDAMKSGPAYRRRARRGTLLQPIGNLRFEESTEHSDLFLECHSGIVMDKDAQKNKDALDMEQEKSEGSLAVIEELEGLTADTGKLSIVGTQNMSSKEMEHNFGGIGDESREQNRGYALDSTNYFGGRRILSVLNESNVSINTPGKGDQLSADAKVSSQIIDGAPGVSDNSASPVHIVAARDLHKKSAVLCARKIVHSEEGGQGVRRSTRNRVAPIRRWLGEKLVYRRDQQGTLELIGVEEAVVKDPLYLRYNTINMDQVIERQRREQKQHARARRLRENARRERAEKQVR